MIAASYKVIVKFCQNYFYDFKYVFSYNLLEWKLGTLLKVVVISLTNTLILVSYCCITNGSKPWQVKIIHVYFTFCGCDITGDWSRWFSSGPRMRFWSSCWPTVICKCDLLQDCSQGAGCWQEDSIPCHEDLCKRLLSYFRDRAARFPLNDPRNEGRRCNKFSNVLFHRSALLCGQRWVTRHAPRRRDSLGHLKLAMTMHIFTS